MRNQSLSFFSQRVSILRKATCAEALPPKTAAEEHKQQTNGCRGGPPRWWPRCKRAEDPPGQQAKIKPQCTDCLTNALRGLGPRAICGQHQCCGDPAPQRQEQQRSASPSRSCHQGAPAANAEAAQGTPSPKGSPRLSPSLPDPENRLT